MMPNRRALRRGLPEAAPADPPPVALVIPVPSPPARRSLRRPEVVPIPRGRFLMGIPIAESRRECASRDLDGSARPPHDADITSRRAHTTQADSALLAYLTVIEKDPVAVRHALEG